MTREQLIELCKDAVVHHTKWNDRDCYSAQRGIQSIYEGLTAGLDFTYKEDKDGKTIDIEFTQPIDFEKLRTGKHLDISSREDYFKDCDPDYETEMFQSEGIDFNSSWTQTYMPTRKRIEEVGIGEDWY